MRLCRDNIYSIKLQLLLLVVVIEVLVVVIFKKAIVPF